MSLELLSHFRVHKVKLTLSRPDYDVHNIVEANTSTDHFTRWECFFCFLFASLLAKRACMGSVPWGVKSDENVLAEYNITASCTP